jgi:hypothetical protein
MAAGTVPGGATGVTTPDRLNVAYHLVIGVAIGLVSLFTLLAWPFAVPTGMVIGKADSNRRLGRRQGASAIQILAVTGGVLGMLLFGALIGGLIAFIVVALAAFSERVAENTSPVDQTMARIIVALVAVVTYAVGWFGLAAVGFQLQLNFGG